MRLFIIALSVLLLNVALADEPSKKSELPKKFSTEDRLRLDLAQSHIREIVLTAQANIGAQNEIIQSLCNTYKIEPCTNLEQIVDLKTGEIKRPVKPEPEKKASAAAAPKTPAPPNNK